MTWEPWLIGFLEKWTAGLAAESAGVNRVKYSPNIVLINIPCPSRLSPVHIVKAFLAGADGVYIGGSMPPANCHYKVGNYKTFKRMYLLKKLMAQFGIEPERLRMDWYVSPMYRALAKNLDEFVETIKKLGPITSRGRVDGL